MFFFRFQIWDVGIEQCFKYDVLHNPDLHDFALSPESSNRWIRKVEEEEQLVFYYFEIFPSKWTSKFSIYCFLWKVEIRHLSLLRGMHNRLSKNYFEIAMRYYTLRTQTSWIDLMMKLIKVQERSINCWNSASVQPSRGTPPTIKHGGSRWRSATCSRITILQFVRAGELPTMTRVSSSFLVFLNVATPFRRSCDRHYEFGHPIDFRCIREEHGVCRSISLQTGVVRRPSEIHWASGIENSNFFSLKKIF